MNDILSSNDSTPYAMTPPPAPLPAAPGGISFASLKRVDPRHSFFAANRNAASSMSDRAKRLARVLIVDDDPLVRKVFETGIGASGYTVTSAPDGKTALELLRREPPDVVVLDNILPDVSGLEILRRIREFDPHLPVILITAQGTSLTAIEAMKSAAFDYIPKPVDLGRLDSQIGRAVEARRLMRVPVVSAGGPAADGGSDVLIGRSPAMQDVFKAVGRVAMEDVPILIEGEPGTGKELTARAIYHHGPRSGGPFCVVNCADFDAAALDVELFGSEDESGGGRHTGRVEQCRGGVLLLEEVGRLSPPAQSRLLRLLRDREFERVGGRETLSADVQVIVSTTGRLESLVDQGRFRTDLYYHLVSFRIALPPLRKREEDIPLLVEHFVKQFSGIGRSLSAAPIRISDEALQLLSRHAWPGNLDELRSVLRRALVETKGTVVASDFLLSALGGEPAVEQGRALGVTNWRMFAEARASEGSQHLYADAVEEMERNLLRQVLDATGGNQARAARILGITRGNLRKKIRTLGLELTSNGRHPGAAPNGIGEHVTAAHAGNASPRIADADDPDDESE
jgi:two-component system nitrogen regulation response regulator GlnG